jgi:hypothetical protein
MIDSDVKVMSVAEYERLSENEKQYKIVLDTDNESWLKFITDKYGEKAKETAFIRDLNYNAEFGYQEFLSLLGKGQRGKSVLLCNILAWRNQTTDIFKFDTYDLNTYLERAATYYKSYIALEEAERHFRSHSTAETQEISNTIIDFYETSPYKQNSLVLTQPSLRLLKYLKPKIDHVLFLVKRGKAKVYKTATQLGNDRIFFKFQHEVIDSYPLPLQLYEDYEKYSFEMKQKFLDEDKRKIEMSLKNPYI